MLSCFGRFLGTLCLAAALLPAGLCAQDHVVSRAELSAQLRSAAAGRAQDIAVLQRFLSSDAARRSIQSLHLDPAKVRQAVPVLCDQELARLAAQAAQVQPDFAAGALTHFQITLIIIGAIILGIVVAIAAA